jgi:8-oxo-dGTP pyrophosphatase MutT (NUDIX family)
MSFLTLLSLDQLRKLLTSDIFPHIEDHEAKHAAVLIVIYGQDPKIIMTQKPMTMQQHAGEISFPGGKIADDDEDLLDTAIRETFEEISLQIMRKHVIGQLKPVRTRNSGFTIIPFVAVLEEISSLHPNSEVDEILHIPTIPLLRTLDVDDNEEHRSLFEAYKLTYSDKIIWGASARMLKQIADILKQHNLL